jgi:hypothetical protein
MLFLMVNNRVRKYLLSFALIAVIVVVSRPGIWETVVGLYDSTTDASSPVGASYLYRDTLTIAIKAAVAKDTTRLLLGYGLGTFRELGLDITFLDVTQRWYTCDNNWDAFLYETGYVGLGIIFCLLCTPLFIAFRSYIRLPKPQKYLSGVLFIALTGFYFLLMSVAGYSWGQQGYLAWILISLVVSYPRVALQHDDLVEENDEQLEGAPNYDLHVA